MAQSLYELLHDCTVCIVIPGISRGTGFFVAPGLILTCAHVVEAARENDTPVEVHLNGQVTTAQIQEFRNVPYPDLAILQVNLSNHPCVLLYGGAEPFSELYSYGYPDIEPQGASTTFACEGWAGGQQELLRFKQGQVRPGMSGSPLLNQKTGSVCGIVQVTRDRHTDLGGKALLTGVVFREFPELVTPQKQFHQQDRHWADHLTSQQRQRLKLDWLPTSTPAGTAKNLSRKRSSGFDASFYADTFIRQYENRNLREKERPIVGPIFRSNLFATYVPLGFNDEKGNFFDSLDEFVQKWLGDDERRYLVLLGEYGSGKTSYGLFLMYALLRRYSAGSNDVLPIYLSFRDLLSRGVQSSPEKIIFDLLSERLGIKLGKAADFAEVLRNHKFLLILDGFDEIINSLDVDHIQRQFFELREVLQRCGKVIITCRTNYFSSERNVRYIFPLSSQDYDLLDDILGGYRFELIYLSDFDKGRREQYLERSVKDEQRRGYISETIQKVYNLADLSRRPILLSMIVNSFDQIAKSTREIITATYLYDKYTDTWLQREFLSKRSDISVKEKRAVLERLALKLFEESAEEIHRERLAAYLSEWFQGRQVSFDQIEYDFAACSFLTRTKDEYFGFIHRSFLEFFVARALLNEILTNEPVFFGRSRLFGIIATFLAELVKQHKVQDEVEECLKLWMIRSPTVSDTAPYLGGNSASLLCRLGFKFEGLNLSGTYFKDADLTRGNFCKCILRDANLDGSILIGADFSDSDLQNTELCNTFIKATLFRRSDLRGASFKNIRIIGGPNTLWKAAFTLDRTNIALGTDRGDFVVLPFSEKGIERPITLRIDETGVLHFTFSPDGKLLALSDRDRKIYLYSWPKLLAGEIQQPRVFSDNADNVRWLDFSPESDMLASGGRDHLVKLWYLGTHSHVRELAFHSGPIMSTIWSPTGDMIASGGYDKNICLWLVEGKDVMPVHVRTKTSRTSHDAIIRSLAFNKAGTVLASGGEDNVLKLWDLSEPRRPKLAFQSAARTGIFCLEFIKQDKTLLIGGADGSLWSIDVIEGRQTQRIQAHHDMMRSLSVDEAAGLLLTASWDGTVKLWSLSNLSLIKEIFRLDQEETQYGQEDAFQQARIRGIKHAQLFKKYFIKLGAVDE